jgi:hypothetical protein
MNNEMVEKDQSFAVGSPDAGHPRPIDLQPEERRNPEEDTSDRDSILKRHMVIGLHLFSDYSWTPTSIKPCFGMKQRTKMAVSKRVWSIRKIHHILRFEPQSRTQMTLASVA